MDCANVGKIIRELRCEKNLTQKQLADKMNISDKTVSKWERGLGCPDVTLLAELSDILGIRIESILNGNLDENEKNGGNMKNSKYYVCPSCGGITLCSADAAVSCCGRQLTPLEAKKADETEKLRVEQIENDWYITTDHPMEKEHYIAFAAFATGGAVQLIRQYPQWDFQLRIARREHGKLLWYCTQHGLFYQYL